MLAQLAAPAGVAYAVVTAAVVLFQVALALGAPWGGYAMGGSAPGRFPPALRIAAFVQACLLAVLAALVRPTRGLFLPDTARAAPWLIWLPVAVSAVALVLNTITPSTGERRLWAPVAALMLLTSLVVAIAPG